MSDQELSIASIKGAEEVLSTLQEEFSEWLEEANNEGQREALENVVAHVTNLQREYLRRRHEAEVPKLTQMSGNEQ